LKGVRSWQSFRAQTVARIHRWVLWWFDAGLVIAAVALANVPFLNLTRAQEKAIFTLCVLNWLLSGLVCWAYENTQSNAVQPWEPIQREPAPQDREWHSASEFRLPGSGKTLLPLSNVHHTRETLAHYGFHHREGRRHQA
jgi:hypothetical protein